MLLDVDECEENPGICAETLLGGDICTNTVGDYTCTDCTEVDSETWGYYERSQCCRRSQSIKCSVV